MSIPEWITKWIQQQDDAILYFLPDNKPILPDSEQEALTLFITIFNPSQEELNTLHHLLPESFIVSGALRKWHKCFQEGDTEGAQRYSHIVRRKITENMLCTLSQPSLSSPHEWAHTHDPGLISNLGSTYPPEILDTSVEELERCADVIINTPTEAQEFQPPPPMPQHYRALANALQQMSMEELELHYSQQSNNRPCDASET